MVFRILRVRSLTSVPTQAIAQANREVWSTMQTPSAPADTPARLQRLLLIDMVSSNLWSIVLTALALALAPLPYRKSGLRKNFASFNFRR